jgi:hypothetical protein
LLRYGEFAIQTAAPNTKFCFHEQSIVVFVVGLQQTCAETRLPPRNARVVVKPYFHNIPPAPLLPSTGTTGYPFQQNECSLLNALPFTILLIVSPHLQFLHLIPATT